MTDSVFADEDGSDGADLAALPPFLECDIREWKHWETVTCHVDDVVDSTDPFEESDNVFFNVRGG